jgi:hypothetical protein
LFTSLTMCLLPGTTAKTSAVLLQNNNTKIAPFLGLFC